MQTIYSQTRFDLNNVGFVTIKSRGQIRAAMVPLSNAKDDSFVDNILNNTLPTTMFQSECDGKHTLIVEPVDSRADVEISYNNRNGKSAVRSYGRAVAAGNLSLSEWWTATSNIYKTLIIVVSVVLLLLIMFVIWMIYKKKFMMKGGNKLRYTARY